MPLHKRRAGPGPKMLGGDLVATMVKDMGLLSEAEAKILKTGIDFATGKFTYTALDKAVDKTLEGA